MFAFFRHVLFLFSFLYSASHRIGKGYARQAFGEIARGNTSARLNRLKINWYFFDQTLILRWVPFMSFLIHSSFLKPPMAVVMHTVDLLAFRVKIRASKKPRALEWAESFFFDHLSFIIYCYVDFIYCWWYINYFSSQNECWFLIFVQGFEESTAIGEDHRRRRVAQSFQSKKEIQAKNRREWVRDCYFPLSCSWNLLHLIFI